MLRTTMPEPTNKLPRNIGILWDLDGVLVDTGESHYQAWAETCARYSIPFSREAFRQTFGMNNVKIVGTLTGRVVAPELVAEISDYQEQPALCPEGRPSSSRQFGGPILDDCRQPNRIMGIVHR